VVGSGSEARVEVETLVIGGGVTGLAVGWLLAAKGERVQVLERADRLGGAVQTEECEGYLCEAGPNSMLVKSQEVWDLIDQLGLSPSRVEANTVANKRFLVKSGRVVALPQSPWGGLLTPLYGPMEKLRLLKEPFVGRSELADESVTSFVTRRMGAAFLEYGISALVSGIFAGDPDRLSLRHGFPKVWNLEQQYGSLIGGAVQLKRARARSGEVPFKSRMVSFRRGLGELTAALASRDGLDTATRVEVTALRREAGGWAVDAGARRYQSRRLVLATPLGALAGLPCEAKVREQLERIPPIDHPPLSTLVLGFDRGQVGHPLDGFGVLFPRLERRFCLGCIFSSTLFPGRAPEGKVSLMCFVGGVQQPENGRLPTSRLVEAVVEDLRPLLGLRGDPEFHAHTFWPAAIPQYNVGHSAFLASLEAVESAVPGLHILGNFRGGPGLNDCLQSALRFAGH
jgi:oxygen-dependent protoporphyrinogen oxidase